MQPLILHYAKKKTHKKSPVEMNLHYDMNMEAMVTGTKSDFAICGPEVASLTGSYITEAGDDTTSDESTDR